MVAKDCRPRLEEGKKNILISSALFVYARMKEIRIYSLHSNVTFASSLAAPETRHRFSFYQGLVYNLLLIKAKAEQDLESGPPRADVGRIEMSECRSLGWRRCCLLPAWGWHGGLAGRTNATPPLARKGMGRGSLQRAGVTVRAPRGLSAANTRGRWGMHALAGGWAPSSCPHQPVSPPVAARDGSAHPASFPLGMSRCSAFSGFWKNSSPTSDPGVCRAPNLRPQHRAHLWGQRWGGG